MKIRLKCICHDIALSDKINLHLELPCKQKMSFCRISAMSEDTFSQDVFFFHLRARGRDLLWTKNALQIRVLTVATHLDTRCSASFGWLHPPTVPEGHKHRVTAPEKPGKIPRTPAEPRRAPQNPRRDPAEPSERPPQSPLRGKFPRRASRRVVPLGW